MKSTIYEIQDVVIKLAEAMSVMLQADVEVIDTNHIRIAGTGAFREHVNESNIEEGHAYKEVILTGKRLIVKEPIKSEYCRDCSERDSCKVQMEVGAPILVDGRIEGVIGITCWKKEQSNYFADNLDKCMSFLDQMCDLVAGKIKERISIQKHISMGNMLHAIMHHVDKGVIILDSGNHLVEYNETAERELKLEKKYIGKFINIILTGDNVTGKQEYKAVLDNNVTTIIGSSVNFDNEDDLYSKIYIFDSIREYRNQIYNAGYNIIPYDINSIIGNSDYTIKLKKKIYQAAENNSPVLIEAEEGSGKRVVGTAIWKASSRADKPFVYFNCNSVEENKLADKLFGSITDEFDKRGNIGVIEMANDGILYLDEIDELPLLYQAKLEEVLEEKVINRVGSSQKIQVNTRIIAATKKNLAKMVEKNKFRKNLFYMLGISKITVLPLRMRKEDIPEMVKFFIEQYSQKYRINFKQITKDAMDKLVSYNWYGNITELKNTIEYMVNEVGEDEIIGLNTMPAEMKEIISEQESENTIQTLEEVEKHEIQKAMAKFGYSKKGKEQAAEALGIGIATLYRKLERL